MSNYEMEFYQRMKAICVKPTDLKTFKNYSPYSRINKVSPVGCSNYKSIEIPGQIDGQDITFLAGEVKCENVIIPKTVEEIDARFFTNVKKVCFEEGSCLGKIFVRMPLYKMELEEVNFPPQADIGDLIDGAYYTSFKPNFFDRLPVDSKGRKMLQNNMYSCDRSMDVYDTEDSCGAFLAWVSPERRCEKVIIRSNVRNVYFPKDNLNCIGEFEVVDNKRFEVVDGVLYHLTARKRELLFVNKDCQLKHLEVDSKTRSIMPIVSSTIETIVIDSKIKIPDKAFDLSTVKAIVVKNPDVKLKTANFVNYNKGVTIYGDKSNMRLKKSSKVIVKPLSEYDGDATVICENNTKTNRKSKNKKTSTAKEKCQCVNLTEQQILQLSIDYLNEYGRTQNLDINGEDAVKTALVNNYFIDWVYGIIWVNKDKPNGKEVLEFWTDIVVKHRAYSTLRYYIVYLQSNGLNIDKYLALYRICDPSPEMAFKYINMLASIMPASRAISELDGLVLVKNYNITSPEEELRKAYKLFLEDGAYPHAMYMAHLIEQSGATVDKTELFDACRKMDFEIYTTLNIANPGIDMDTVQVELVRNYDCNIIKNALAAEKDLNWKRFWYKVLFEISEKYDTDYLFCLSSDVMQFLWDLEKSSERERGLIAWAEYCLRELNPDEYPGFTQSAETVMEILDKEPRNIPLKDLIKEMKESLFGYNRAIDGEYMGVNLANDGPTIVKADVFRIDENNFWFRIPVCYDSLQLDKAELTMWESQGWRDGGVFTINFGPEGLVNNSDDYSILSTMHIYLEAKTSSSNTRAWFDVQLPIDGESIGDLVYVYETRHRFYSSFKKATCYLNFIVEQEMKIPHERHFDNSTKEDIAALPTEIANAVL